MKAAIRTSGRCEFGIRDMNGRSYDRLVTFIMDGSRDRSGLGDGDEVIEGKEVDDATSAEETPE